MVATLLLVLFCSPLNSFATGQDGDIVIIDDEEWELLARPIYSSGISKEFEAMLPKERSKTTANWEGYTAIWSIRDNMLVLDSIRVGYASRQNPQMKYQTLPAQNFTTLFGKYQKDGRIVATWYSDTIRAGRGSVVLYEHSGYMRNYENEMVLRIVNGKVNRGETYNNGVVTKGFSIHDFEKMNDADRRQLLDIHPEKYPDLSGKSRVLVQMSKLTFDAQGNLCDGNIKVLLPQQGGNVEVKPLSTAVKKALINIKPWKVLRINGSYQTDFYGLWNLPVKLTD